LQQGRELGCVVPEIAASIAVRDVIIKVGGGRAIDDAGQVVVDFAAGSALVHGEPPQS
jgi:hypothetical protein